VHTQAEIETDWSQLLQGMGAACSGVNYKHAGSVQGLPPPPPGLLHSSGRRQLQQQQPSNSILPQDPCVESGMFASVTAAAGSYGCEVWSTHFQGGWCLLDRPGKLQSYQATVYKQSLGCPGPQPTC
jgi:hypothetical protein